MPVYRLQTIAMAVEMMAGRLVACLTGSCVEWAAPRAKLFTRPMCRKGKNPRHAVGRGSIELEKAGSMCSVAGHTPSSIDLDKGQQDEALTGSLEQGFSPAAELEKGQQGLLQGHSYRQHHGAKETASRQSEYRRAALRRCGESKDMERQDGSYR